MRGLWRMLRSHHLCVTNLMGEKLHVGSTEVVMIGVACVLILIILYFVVTYTTGLPQLKINLYFKCLT